MSYNLLQSSRFTRQLKRVLKNNPELKRAVLLVLQTLAEDPYHPRLKTHKLKGDLKRLWACSAAYDLRVLFEFVEHEGEKAILLETIGTYDEVY
ncbi:MAG: type II toxin-antitoxin system YafQ family toxin [Planctomycetes bacterium]|nr:type II toxin-antitoxin system YafQ family toxin [Planctomycetota bacterium]